jgi:hypothetical protein
MIACMLLLAHAAEPPADVRPVDVVIDGELTRVPVEMPANPRSWRRLAKSCNEETGSEGLEQRVRCALVTTVRPPPTLAWPGLAVPVVWPEPSSEIRAQLSLLDGDPKVFSGAGGGLLPVRLERPGGNPVAGTILDAGGSLCAERSFLVPPSVAHVAGACATQRAAFENPKPRSLEEVGAVLRDRLPDELVRLLRERFGCPYGPPSVVDVWSPMPTYLLFTIVDVCGEHLSPPEPPPSGYRTVTEARVFCEIEPSAPMVEMQCLLRSRYQEVLDAPEGWRGRVVGSYRDVANALGAPQRDWPEKVTQAESGLADTVWEAAMTVLARP